MTAACGGAASRARSWVPPAVFISGETLVALVAQTLSVSNVWPALLAYAAAQTIQSTTFCQTDPPPMPTFTADDVIGIITGAGPGQFTGPQKLNNLVLIAAWYTLCECSTVTTPAPPAPPAYPTTGPVVNPPELPTRAQSPCWSATQTYQVAPRVFPCDPIFTDPQLLPGPQSCFGNATL